MTLRIALLDRDGSISEVAAGTTSVDPTSGTVDLDVAWNVGSVTKTFVAVVVMQLAEEGRIDLDGASTRSCRRSRAPIGSPLATCCSTPAGSPNTATRQPC